MGQGSCAENTPMVKPPPATEVDSTQRYPRAQLQDIFRKTQDLLLPVHTPFLEIRSGHCREPLVSSAEDVLLIRLALGALRRGSWCRC